MKNRNRLISFLISFLFSILLWVLINRFLIEISFWKCIIIEFSMAISYLFSKFVKEQVGIYEDIDTDEFIS